MFRRKRSDPPVQQPEWRERFDAAARTIRARRPPSWIDDRLTDLERALVAAQGDADRLSESIARLDPERASRELKRALRDEQRRLPTDADGDKRLAVLRQRYTAVNDMMNQHRDTQRRIADSVADLELLAVDAERDGTGFSSDPQSLDEHMQRLDVDLRALSLARDELRSW